MATDRAGQTAAVACLEQVEWQFPCYLTPAEFTVTVPTQQRQGFGMPHQAVEAGAQLIDPMHEQYQMQLRRVGQEIEGGCAAGG